jgi:hypothetical protein
MLVVVSFYTSVGLVQRSVPQQPPSHFWQLVKLFDLAAIAIKAWDNRIPLEHRTEHYTAEALYRDFIAA